MTGVQDAHVVALPLPLPPLDVEINAASVRHVVGGGHGGCDTGGLWENKRIDTQAHHMHTCATYRIPKCRRVHSLKSSFCYLEERTLLHGACDPIPRLCAARLFLPGPFATYRHSIKGIGHDMKGMLDAHASSRSCLVPPLTPNPRHLYVEANICRCAALALPRYACFSPSSTGEQCVARGGA
jgi:hypothetical protein